MQNYYCFFPHIANTLAPLHAQASGKGQGINWSEDRQSAFQKAKDTLCKATVLHHPHSQASTSSTVDASNTAMGAQLEQLHEDLWVPITIFSHKVSETEKKYSVFDRELLAVITPISISTIFWKDIHSHCIPIINHWWLQ